MRVMYYEAIRDEAGKGFGRLGRRLAVATDLLPLFQSGDRDHGVLVKIGREDWYPIWHEVYVHPEMGQTSVIVGCRPCTPVRHDDLPEDLWG